MLKQKRTFKAHSSLLRGVITRQANSLQRALQEGVQNSVDSDSTVIHITTANDRVTIADNGTGFKTEKHIIESFEHFGQPPDAKVNKTFGEHGMGRGQLFNYGKTVYHSNNFKMTVDIHNEKAVDADDDLGYTLEQAAESYQGCEVTIDLYKKLTTAEKVDLDRALSDSFAYLITDVFLNGRKINKNPSEIQWNSIGQLFVANLDMSHSLAVYNKGVKVNDYPRATYGIGGVLVSSVDLRLTFSRTEIMDSCMHWKAIVEELTPMAEKIRKKNNPANEEIKPAKKKGDFSGFAKIERLKASERLPRLKKILENGAPFDNHDFGKPLILAWNDQGHVSKYMSLKKLERISRNKDHRLVVMPPHYLPFGFKKVDYAVPFHPATLRKLNMEMEEFVEKVNKVFNTRFKQVTSEQVDEIIRNYEIIEKKDNLSDAEQVVRHAIENAVNRVFRTYAINTVAICTFGNHPTGIKVTRVNNDPTLLFDRNIIKYMLSDAGNSLNVFIDIGEKILNTILENDEKYLDGRIKTNGPDVANVAAVGAKLVLYFATDLSDELLEVSNYFSKSTAVAIAKTKDLVHMYNEFGKTSETYRNELVKQRDELTKLISEHGFTNQGLTLREYLTIDETGKVATTNPDVSNLLD